MNLFEILIVEDEQHIRDGVARVFAEFNFFNINAVSSAEEALDFIRLNKVDAMLLDIRLPNMSGIELLLKLESAEQPLTVIISGYDSFEYAQKAIAQNVIDYILKPLTPDRVRKIAGNLERELKQRQKNEREKLHLTRKAKKAEPLIIRQFFDSVLSKSISVEEIISYAQELGLSTDEPFWRIIIFKINSDGTGKINAVNKQLHNKMLLYLNQQLSDSKINILSYDLSTIIIFENSNTLTGAGHSYHFFQKLQNDLQKMFKNRIFLGVGSWVEAFCSVSRSFEQAGKSIIEQQHEVPLGMNLVEKINPEPDGIKEEIRCRDVHSLVRNLDKAENMRYLKDELCSESASEHDRIRTALQYTDLLLIMLSEYEATISVELESCLKNVFDAIRTNAVFNLYNVFDVLVTEVFSVIEEQRVECGTHLINLVKSYIKKHYKEEFTLSALASRIQYSPNYISSVFRRETGMTVVDFLHTVRIDEAKKLLKNSTRLLQEVAEQVGYNDQYYFSRVFKRYAGITANSFRNS